MSCLARVDVFSFIWMLFGVLNPQFSKLKAGSELKSVKCPIMFHHIPPSDSHQLTTTPTPKHLTVPKQPMNQQAPTRPTSGTDGPRNSYWTFVS